VGHLGDGPSKTFEEGNGPCIRLPNILRSTVIGCEAKYELIKKMVIYQSSDSRDRQKT